MSEKKIITLSRTHEEDGFTLGKIELPCGWTCDTVELPWRDNEQDVSCIPQGEYWLEKRTVGGYYARYKERWGHEFSIWVRGVPDRTYILIHTGNSTEDTAGCVIVGQAAHPGLVINSRKTYEQLYNRAKDLWDGEGRGPFFEVKDAWRTVESEAEFTDDERDVLGYEQDGRNL